MIRIAIFASGAGSNAANLFRHFSGSDKIEVALIVTNNPHAGVIGFAIEHNIPYKLINRDDFKTPASLINELKIQNVSWIILAGFLWKVPAQLINEYNRRIVNIHPALLPKYGGKGMYGHFVHEAVAKAGENESGITIHFVDEQYDHGDSIFQARVQLEKGISASEIEKRVRALEIEHFPVVIERLITGMEK